MYNYFIKKTSLIFILFPWGLVAQWITRLTTDQKIPNPGMFPSADLRKYFLRLVAHKSGEDSRFESAKILSWEKYFLRHKFLTKNVPG